MKRKRKPTRPESPRRKKPDSERHRGIPFDGRAPSRREQQNLSRFIYEEIE